MSGFTRSLRRTIAEFGRDAVGLLYPPVCVRCGTSTSSQPVSERFCPDCHDGLAGRIADACLICGAPVGPNLQMRGCRHCRKDNFAFDRAVALGVYEKELKTCCQRVKQPFEAPLAAGLADLLWQAHESVLTSTQIDLVVPVPHHWWERTTRRHLPPATMGRVLARRLSIPMATHILAKRRRTPAQSSLSPSKRRKNLREAFQIAGGARLNGLTILLTDDILTTGTTADRAARTLRDGGAEGILVAVFARGLGQDAAT